MTTPRFIVVPMSEQHGMAISRWRYPPPYTVYNWDSWHNMVQCQYEFAHPGIRREQYRAVVSPELGLCGFAQLFPMLHTTRLGLGLHPKLCGKGYGSLVIRAIVDEAIRCAPRNEIDLEVSTWNRRAIKAYEKAGFLISDTYDKPSANGTQSVHCMVYSGQPEPQVNRSEPYI